MSELDYNDARKQGQLPQYWYQMFTGFKERLNGSNGDSDTNAHILHCANCAYEDLALGEQVKALIDVLSSDKSMDGIVGVIVNKLEGYQNG